MIGSEILPISTIFNDWRANLAKKIFSKFQNLFEITCKFWTFIKRVTRLLWRWRGTKIFPAMSRVPWKNLETWIPKVRLEWFFEYFRNFDSNRILTMLPNVTGKEIDPRTGNTKIFKFYYPYYLLRWWWTSKPTKLMLIDAVSLIKPRLIGIN